MEKLKRLKICWKMEAKQSSRLRNICNIEKSLSRYENNNLR
jgi:hypothetical protein